MMTVSVSDKYTDEGKELDNRLLNLLLTNVDVGFFAGRHFKTGRDGKTKDIVQIAAENEMGCGRIPSRPFMSQSADALNGKDGDEIVGYSAAYIQNGGSADDLFNKIGKLCVSVIQRTIKTGRFKPNSPLTIALKHSSQPLIDTGTMYNSVEYEIREEGEG